jgi:hypothetical protein
MKKFIILIASVLFAIGLSSCSSCSSSTPKLGEAVAPLSVEHVIAADREAMYLKAGEDYRWYETGVQLKNFLDEENDGSIEMIVNVFQVVEQYDSTSFDTFVFKFQHFADGTVAEDSVHGFWVEDYPLNEEVIKVTFNEALEKLNEVNYPKPHSRQVVLRKEVGSVDANPQWIFGNMHYCLFVDAVTGAVTDKDPAFGGLNLGTPLGEWP